MDNRAPLSQHLVDSIRWKPPQHVDVHELPLGWAQQSWTIHINDFVHGRLHHWTVWQQFSHLVCPVAYLIDPTLTIRFTFSYFSVVLRFSKMKTVTNLYILNLAFADEFFLVGVPVLIYTMHLGEWIFGVYLCKLYMISTSITQFTSSIFLVIMSADRFGPRFWDSNWVFIALITFQIYCCVPSHKFTAFSNAAGIEGRIDHSLVRVGGFDAANHPLFDDNHKTGWQENV